MNKISQQLKILVVILSISLILGIVIFFDLIRDITKITMNSNDIADSIGFSMIIIVFLSIASFALWITQLVFGIKLILDNKLAKNYSNMVLATGILACIPLPFVSLVTLILAAITFGKIKNDNNEEGKIINNPLK